MRADQIRLLYQQLPTALIATVIIGIITAYILWQHLPHVAIVVWLAYILGLSLARALLLLAYQRVTPKPAEARYWGRLFLAGAGLGGASWGLLSVLLFPSENLAYQAFIGFVVTGMSAGSLSTLPSYPGAVLTFIVPAVLPYAARLLMENDPTRIAMGGMALLYIVLMHIAARRLNAAFTDSLSLRYENVDLLDHLRLAHEQQAIVNRDLQAEVVERSNTQAKLQEREAFVHAVVNSLSASIAVLSGDGRVISTNQAWEAHAASDDEPLLHGVTPTTDYVAHCAAAARQDPVAGQVGAGVESMLMRTAPETIIEYRRRQPAADQWYRIWITQLRSAQGGAVISHLNITQRKQAEERLLLAAVFENTSEAIFILDTRLRVVAVNRAFTEISGYRPDEAVGMRPNRFHPYRGNGGFHVGLHEAVRHAGRWQGETVGRRKDGRSVPVWASLNIVRDDSGKISHYIIVFSDITRRKETERHLSELAYRDALTGLPNRTVLRERLRHALVQARRHGGSVAVMFLDLDHFKLVNDTLGHEAGDRLLLEMAQRLVQCVREGDIVARLGGDEFTVVLELTSSRDVAKVARKILRMLRRPVSVSGQEIYTSASIGISIYPDDGDTENAILKNADTAMYRAKERGRNRYQFYTARMNAVALERMWLETNLRRAIDRHELRLVYQPIVRINTGEIYKCEALLRWQHPERGCILPGEFIPMAEDTGFIVPLSKWVLRQVCDQMCEWRQRGLPAMISTINISGRQFRRRTIEPALGDYLQQAQLAPEHLEVELTESSLMRDQDTASVILQELHDSGIGIALDDFGTGYSSLSFLKRFPIDVVKIDRSFITNITIDPYDAAIAAAIIAMAHGLELEVVAEGVETAEQLAILKHWGCDAAQGYHLSPPLTPEGFTELMERNVRLA